MISNNPKNNDSNKSFSFLAKSTKNNVIVSKNDMIKSWVKLKEIKIDI